MPTRDEVQTHKAMQSLAAVPDRLEALADQIDQSGGALTEKIDEGGAALTESLSLIEGQLGMIESRLDGIESTLMRSGEQIKEGLDDISSLLSRFLEIAEADDE